jgi:hypothetical protein
LEKGVTSSFDEDGDCTVTGLPWENVSHFAVSEGNSTRLSKVNFLDKVVLPDSIRNDIAGHNVTYLSSDDDDVFMLYDEDTDVHYFFI